MSERGEFGVSFDDSWNGERRSSFERVAREVLLPIVQKNIIISVPHGSRDRLGGADAFRIKIWSSVGGSDRGKRRPPDKIFGVKVDCKDEAFLPSSMDNSCYLVTCPQTGYVAAELFPDTLFIHHDICHNGTENEFSLFRIILQEIATYLELPDEELALRLEKENKEVAEKLPLAREAFIEACCGDLSRQISEGEGRVRNAKDAIRRLLQDMKEQLKLRNEALKRLGDYTETENVESTFWADEFDKLLQVPDVLGVDIKESVIHVYIGMVVIEHDNIRYSIGKFRIEIPTVYDGTGVKFYNLTNNGHGPGRTRPSGFDASGEYNRHHPHVKEDGIPCLGNIKEAIHNYVKANQYSVVAILAIQFLRTVNVDDGAGKGIFWWPKEEV